MIIKYFYFLLFCSCTFACSVPVFRYALEYWQPDPYRIILSYNPAQTNKFSEVLNELRKYKADSSFILRKIKSTKSNGKIILKYPADKRIKNIVWSAPLSTQSLNRIMYSPMRKKFTDKILNGDSLIFLLLEGSNSKQNDKIANIIITNMTLVKNQIKLPYEYDDIPKEDLSMYDTNIVFKLSMMRLSRTNSREKVFINILTKCLPDTIYKQSEPILFPVFARGRMLVALREKDVNYIILKNLCEYVAGECSCEIKSQNPGFDIFIPLGWNFQKNNSLISDIVLPPLSGFSEFLPPAKSDDTNSNFKK